MDDAHEVLTHLRRDDFLVEDSGQLMIGPAAERAFGRRHFMDLLSSFTAERELRVVAGTKEIGFLSPLALPKRSGDRHEIEPVLMNGRSWWVESVDWERFTVYVSPIEGRGDVKWQSDPIALSFELMQAQRDVLLGSDPDVQLTRRAQERLAGIREKRAAEVDSNGLVVQRDDRDVRLWTWAGLKANETLRAALGGPEGRSYNDVMVLRGVDDTAVISGADVTTVVPVIPEEMVRALKFSAALPSDVAARTLGERFADPVGANAIARGQLIRAER
jgi:ATP-dependent Lhr-like helicase